MNRFHGPVAEPFVVFEYFHWNLVVTLERLIRVGAERLHFPLAVFANRRFINFKIQLSLVQDAEESLVPIDPVAAKHPSRVDAVHVLQLIQNKILERFVPEAIVPFLFRNDWNDWNVA